MELRDIGKHFGKMVGMIDCTLRGSKGGCVGLDVLWLGRCWFRIWVASLAPLFDMACDTRRLAASIANTISLGFLIHQLVAFVGYLMFCDRNFRIVNGSSWSFRHQQKGRCSLMNPCFFSRLICVDNLSGEKCSFCFDSSPSMFEYAGQPPCVLVGLKILLQT